MKFNFTEISVIPHNSTIFGSHISIPYQLQYNARVPFSKMTFCCAFNSNFEQICTFYLRKLLKKWTFRPILGGVHSIQEEQYIEADTVDSNSWFRKARKNFETNFRAIRGPPVT